jgi:hypothetical protein
MDMTPSPPGPSQQQLRYARVIQGGVLISTAILIAGFALYVLGLLPPRVALDQLPRYWSLSAHDYAVATGQPAGWKWLSAPFAGDTLPMLGILSMAGLSAMASLAVIPVYLRQRDPKHALVLLLHVLIVLFSATR